jgi:hypothetical protein
MPRWLTGSYTPKRGSRPRPVLEVGGLYKARKGSWLMNHYGKEASYLLISWSPGETCCVVITPRGREVCDPFDLRPVDG